MKGEYDMATLRLVFADDSLTDEPLRFPTDAVRALNDARATSRGNSASPSSEITRGSTHDVMSALCDVTRRVNALNRDLDVLGHLGSDDDDDDDPPRAA